MFYTGYGTYQSKFGDTYTGFLPSDENHSYPYSTIVLSFNIDSCLSGFGVMNYAKDSTYIGFWNNGNRQGFGTLLKKRFNNSKRNLAQK